MALPSPVAQYADMSGFMADTRARQGAYLSDAIAQLGEVQRAQAMRGQAQEQAQLSAQMGAYGQQAPGAQPGAFANDDWAQHGFGANVPRSLIGTESGGNWNAQNNEAASGGTGHFGILQFSPGRLQDAINSGAIPQMTPEQFKASKQAQVAASNWHFNDIDSRISKNGLDKYLGQNIAGVPMTMNGMRAMAHLGGFGGLSRFLSTNGQHNPADAYGTSLLDYARTHQGG